jgi:signal transduction histidine kinase
METRMTRRTFRTNTYTQVDWLVCNLRWLLLLCVGIVIVLNPSRAAMSDVHMLLPLGLLLGGAVYNLLVMVLLAFDVPVLPVLTVVMDSMLLLGLIITSGGARSSLLFFGLFPIITAALRFGWLAGLVSAVSIVVAYSVMVWRTLPSQTDPKKLAPVLFNAVILLLAAVLTGVLSDRMKTVVSQVSKVTEETELRKLRSAREQVRAIFEMAGMLGATLSYTRILDAILDVASMGLQELGPVARQMVSVVLLYDKGGLSVAASRRLTARDVQKAIPGRAGLVAEAIKSAEPMQSDDPRHDPELAQFVALQGCKSVLCVPLRAGFETYGAVVVGSREPDIFTGEHIEMLTAVCSQATIALQNAQLYQSLQQEKNRIVEIEENARKKLARDLHDGPTQSLAAIAMRLNYTRKLITHQPDKVEEEIARVEELARRTTKEIRHMLFTLRPLVLETQGLVAALEASIQKSQETHPDLAVHLEADRVEDKLDLNAQGVVFYIIEEAVGNARKHAKSSNIWIRLKLEPDAIIAEVQDDGEGFDVQGVTSAYESRGSLGMVNMRERAELINGVLSLDSHPGHGTTITLAVPLQKD